MHPSLDNSPTIQTFEALRPMLFSTAYRMLGSVSDAEDMLQESFLRWQDAASREAHIQSPKAYLITILTRLCLEHLRKAHVRRETYIGPWLPDPFPTDSFGPLPDSAEERFAAQESLSVAFLLLLETLSPVERVVFLLREIFDYDYPSIAQIVQKTETHCRQIAHRAQERIQHPTPRFSVPFEQQQKLLFEFAQSCAQGQPEGLLALLAEDVVFTSDSNGKAKAARRPVYGAQKVTRLLLGLMQKVPEGIEAFFTSLNGSPAIVQMLGDTVHSTTVLQSHQGKITAIYTIVNPEKLRHISRSLASNGITYSTDMT